MPGVDLCIIYPSSQNKYQGEYVTQIIKTSTPGKERAQLSKAIIITIRAFMRKKEPDKETKDILAFIILALRRISEGIDQSVLAWEKRDYWLKADKYRMEWQWTGEFSQDLDKAFQENDWGTITQIFMTIMEKFKNIKVSDRHRMGEPWHGAFQEYQSESR